MKFVNVWSFTLAAALSLATPVLAADSGQELYDDSCIHCHGRAGHGNPISNQFWKLKIPRLDSEYVQKKSDAELTYVILNGKRKMPAAMRGNPEDHHQVKITAVQVPELIAYIRTLKQK